MLPVLDSSGQIMDLLDAHRVLSLSFAPGQVAWQYSCQISTTEGFQSKIFPRLHMILENASHPTEQKEKRPCSWHGWNLFFFFFFQPLLITPTLKKDCKNQRFFQKHSHVPKKPWELKANSKPRRKEKKIYIYVYFLIPFQGRQRLNAVKYSSA